MTTTTIKTFEDALTYTGRDSTVLESFKGLLEQDKAYMEASYKKMVITEALNKEANGGKNWTPDWNDTSQRKYFPWVWLKNNEEGSGFVVDASNYGYTYAGTTFGSRLCFLSAELVEYFNTQFPELLQTTFAD